jgi:hypothetical protein
MSGLQIAQLIPPVGNTPSAPATPPTRPAGAGPGSARTEMPWSNFFPNAPKISTAEGIGAALVLIVFAVVFWFAKNGLRQHLIERNASFSRADRTGWTLWITLMTAAVAAVIGFLSPPTLLAPTVYGPLAAIGAVGLILTVIFYRRSVAR